MDHYYPFTNYPLPYSYQEMEPFIDIQTMYLHHAKHLQTYVDNLNKTLSEYPELWKVSLEQMLANLDKLPESIQTSVCNNGGGVFNHEFFFAGLRNEEGRPQGMLQNQLIREYGSLVNFFAEWKKAALSVFGSGYAWLVTDTSDALKIITTANQNTPLELGLVPLMVIDVWEHAYYLKHKNLRADYIDDWMKVVSWERVEYLYEENLHKNCINKGYFCSQ